MSAPRLFVLIAALLGVGFAGWLLIQLWRWTRLPRRWSPRESIRLPHPAAGWPAVLLPGVGGLLLSGYGAVEALRPEFPADPWQEIIFALLMTLAIVGLAYTFARQELLHLRAFRATRRLLSTVERLVERHRGDTSKLRTLSRSILDTPVPDQSAEPWHGSSPSWMRDVLNQIPHDEPPLEALTDAERASLDRATARYRKAVDQFNGYRR